MNREETKAAIEVMQHFADGGEVERKRPFSDWETEVDNPAWNWEGRCYRKAVIKPSIDWSHVAERFDWMATDEDGETYAYEREPSIRNNIWGASGVHVRVVAFASFKPGTCDWKDSLVSRKEADQ